jgi:hypothetical protein
MVSRAQKNNNKEKQKQRERRRRSELTVCLEAPRRPTSEVMVSRELSL